MQLPNETLKILAIYYAIYRACVRNSEYENSLFVEKARQYERLYKDKESQVDAKTLGLTTPTPIGTVSFKRG